MDETASRAVLAMNRLHYTWKNPSQVTKLHLMDGHVQWIDMQPKMHMNCSFGDLAMHNLCLTNPASTQVP